MRHSFIWYAVLVCLLISCRDKSHDITCLFDPAGKQMLFKDCPVVVSGLQIGRVNNVRLISPAVQIATLEIDQPICVARNAQFDFCETGRLFDNRYQVKIAFKPGQQCLSASDIVRVNQRVEDTSHTLKIDTVTVQLLDSLIRHVSRQLRSRTQ